MRQGVAQAQLERGEVPDMLRRRLLSVRAFDDAGMMVDADVVEGRAVDAVIERMLGVPSTSYVHLHMAKQGCYAARADRA